MITNRHTHIANETLSLILGCFVVGVVFIGVIFQQHQALSKERNLSKDYGIKLAHIQNLSTGISQWFTQIDLYFAFQQGYLIKPINQQAESLTRLSEAYTSSGKYPKSIQQQLNRITLSIELNHETVRSSYSTPLSDTEQWHEIIATSDKKSEYLIIKIEELTRSFNSLEASQEQKVTDLEERFYLIFCTSLLCYLGFVFLLWRYATEKIVKPIQKLTHEASSYSDVKFSELEESTSVSELKQLTKSIHRYLESNRKKSLQLKEQINVIESTRTQLLNNEKLAAVGQLAAGVAHELNTPLGYVKSNINTLRGYITTLTNCAVSSKQATLHSANASNTAQQNHCQDNHSHHNHSHHNLSHYNHNHHNLSHHDKDDAEIQFVLEDVFELIDDCQDGIDRIATIVKGLSRQTKSDSHSSTLEDINNLIEESIKVSWGKIKDNTTIVKNLTPVPLIKCKAGQISQVIINLLVNAHQAFTNHGTITCVTGSNNKYVWIDIIDTGPGISETISEKIFDPFFTTKDLEGTGLGLHIASDIIRSHDGELGIIHSSSEGAHFRIKLPLAN